MTALLTFDDVAELPDDPAEKFIEAEALCRKKIGSAYGDDMSSSRPARLRYIAAMVAIAQRCGVRDIAEYRVPNASTFSESDFANFTNTLDAVLTHLAFGRADDVKKSLIVLSGNIKERLSTLCSHLKEHIVLLETSEARKHHLLRIVEDFEQALVKPRLSITAVATLTLAIVGAIADVGGATSVVKDLVYKIEETVGYSQLKQEEAREQARQLLRPTTPTPLALPPARET